MNHADAAADLVAAVVRSHIGPDEADSPGAQRALALALALLASGASVAEACREGRRVLNRWREVKSLILS